MPLCKNPPRCLPPLQTSTSTCDRKHADKQMEEYVTIAVMNVITTFFNSPFSDQSTTLQVKCMLYFQSLI